MRKIIVSLIVVLTCIFPMSVSAEEVVDLAPGAKAAYLIDYETGSVLFEKNAHEKLYPASMTKMMSLLLVIEQIHSGDIKWDEMIVASANAASLGGSQIYLQPNEIMSIEDLYKSSAVASANDAITALAERVGGTEANFVAMMNKKAQELGCTNSNFMNPTGLHDANHYSTAHDMAIIAQALIKEGQDDILRYTSEYEDYIREDTENKFWLVNTNKLVRTYQGMDGLKTGFTSQSEYCITVTAERNNFRLIGVVMGESTKESRTKDCLALLDYGFATYKVVTDIEVGTIVTEIPIQRGKPSKVTLKTMDSVHHLTKINETINVLDQSYTILQNKAPLNVGDVVGSITINYTNGYQKTVDLTVTDPILELDYLDILFLTLRHIVF